jgi:glutamyl-Q tRNA(Asp) synthetase
VQGAIAQDLEAEIGDFVLRRADGLFAYQLAVVVDDAWQGLLGLSRPGYAHLPLAVDGDGRKLSKQLASRPVDNQQPGPALLAALRHLGQEPPPEANGRPTEILDWAIRHWELRRVPPLGSRPVESRTGDMG